MPIDERGTPTPRVIARLTPHQVPEGRLVKISHPPYDVLLARVDGRCHAIEDACPHSGWSLCRGRLQAHFVTCAGHGWVIDIRNGEVVRGAGCGERNPIYRVVEHADEVIVYADRP